MREKYLIRFENEAIGLRFDLLTKDFMIGGAFRLREEIEMFITEYFNSEPPDPILVAGRKVKYELKVRFRDYNAGIKRLKESGLLEKVESLGRIVR